MRAAPEVIHRGVGGGSRATSVVRMTPHGESPPTTPIPSIRFRLAEALGRPPARRLTEEEKRAFEAMQDRADAEAERLYGPPLPMAEWRR